MNPRRANGHCSALAVADDMHDHERRSWFTRPSRVASRLVGETGDCTRVAGLAQPCKHASSKIPLPSELSRFLSPPAAMLEDNIQSLGEASNTCRVCCVIRVQTSLILCRGTAVIKMAIQTRQFGYPLGDIVPYRHR